MYKKKNRKNKLKKTNTFKLLILFCIFRWQISIIQQTVSMFHKIFLKTLLIKNKIYLSFKHKIIYFIHISYEGGDACFHLRRISPPANKKSNQIKSLLLSHHHSTSALVSEILTILKSGESNSVLCFWRQIWPKRNSEQSCKRAWSGYYVKVLCFF